MAQFHNAETMDLHPPPLPKMGAKTRLRARGLGRGRRILASGELRLILLYLIHSGVRHGYGLIKAIMDMTGAVYSPSPGAVYPTLTLMLDEAVIKQQVNGAESDEGRRRFVISKEGAAELDVRGAEVRIVIARLAALAEAQASGGAPVITDAMDRLNNALRARASCGGLEEVKSAEIAEWIDELAGKVKPP